MSEVTVYKQVLSFKLYTDGGTCILCLCIIIKTKFISYFDGKSLISNDDSTKSIVGHILKS